MIMYAVAGHSLSESSKDCHPLVVLEKVTCRHALDCSAKGSASRTVHTQRLLFILPHIGLNHSENMYTYMDETRSQGTTEQRRRRRRGSCDDF